MKGFICSNDCVKCNRQINEEHSHCVTFNIYYFRCQFLSSGIRPVLGLGWTAFNFHLKLKELAPITRPLGTAWVSSRANLSSGWHITNFAQFGCSLFFLSVLPALVIFLWSKDTANHQFRPTLWNTKTNRRLLNCRFGRRAQKLGELNSIKCTLAPRPGISTKIQNSIKKRLQCKTNPMKAPCGDKMVSKGIRQMLGYGAVLKG